MAGYEYHLMKLEPGSDKRFTHYCDITGLVEQSKDVTFDAYLLQAARQGIATAGTYHIVVTEKGKLDESYGPLTLSQGGWRVTNARPVCR